MFLFWTIIFYKSYTICVVVVIICFRSFYHNKSRRCFGLCLCRSCLPMLSSSQLVHWSWRHDRPTILDHTRIVTDNGGKLLASADHREHATGDAVGPILSGKFLGQIHKTNYGNDRELAKEKKEQAINDAIQEYDNSISEEEKLRTKELVAFYVQTKEGKSVEIFLIQDYLYHIVNPH